MVSSKNLESGRIAQKQRTRKALLDAAARLMERGERPRISAVAAEAGISRATAYRYFQNEETLLLEAPIAARTLDAGAILPPEGSPSEASERLERVHDYFFDHSAENESAFRRFLQAVHEAELKAPRSEGAPPRAGRRIETIERALDPIRHSFDERSFGRLVHALSTLVGIEAFLVLKDVCGLPEQEARDVTRWAVRSLLDAALEPRSE